MKVVELDGTDVFVIEDFLGAEECAALIDRAEAAGFADAPITTSGGPVMAKEIRNNTRVMIDDPGLAADLWAKARDQVPAEFPDWAESWRAVGLNERFRFYRYDLAETFRPHYDGAFARHESEVSRLTFMVYLNGDCTGGETRFYTDRAELRFAVTPEPGKALVFVHRQLHEGAPVLSGRKYVLRTDVMYRLGPP